MTVPCNLADSTIWRENARHSARFYALRAAFGLCRRHKLHLIYYLLSFISYLQNTAAQGSGVLGFGYSFGSRCAFSSAGRSARYKSTAHTVDNSELTSVTPLAILVTTEAISAG